jgi:hypothetical protein
MPGKKLYFLSVVLFFRRRGSASGDDLGWSKPAAVPSAPAAALMVGRVLPAVPFNHWHETPPEARISLRGSPVSIQKRTRRAAQQRGVHVENVVVAFRSSPGKHQRDHGKPASPQGEPGGETVLQVIESEIAAG